jgi:hypothetical protein
MAPQPTPVGLMSCSVPQVLARGGLTVAAEAANPRPLNVGKRQANRAGKVKLTRSQLVINQRVYQVALLRARALKRPYSTTGSRLRGRE